MATSSTVTFYTGYYAGGKPIVLSANPFDVAQDLSTGNLWQYTGAAWVAPSWQTSITVWLGAAEDVCQRLKSEDTKIPDTVHVYIGTDGAVPPELALTADDLAINHNVGNYNLNVNVLRKDVTTDTFVDVPFPEGYVVTTEDGNWTVLKNFNKCVGYDYATVSLAWTTTADGTGPQSVDYITSAEAEEIASAVIGSGATISGALISGAAIDTTVSGTNLKLDSGGFLVSAGNEEIGALLTITNSSVNIRATNDATINITGDDGVTLSDIFPATLRVNNGEIYASAAEFDGSPGQLALTPNSAVISCQAHGLNIDSAGITADNELIATQPWVLANTSNTGVAMPVVEVVANNTALDVLQSGGAAQELSEITVYYDSGYIDYIEDYPQTYIGSKAITLTKSGGSCVAVFDDEVWASAYNPDLGKDVLVTLNGSMYTVHSGNTVVVSADAQYAFTDRSYPLQGLVASSTDGGFTWHTLEIAGIPWCTYGYDIYASGDGYPQSVSATFAPNDNRVSGALLSNTEIDTVVGDYRLTYTSSGGLMVSGGGVALQVSSGEVLVSADNGEADSASVTINSGGVYVNVDAVAGNKNVTITPDAIVASGASDESVVLSGGTVSLRVNENAIDMDQYSTSIHGGTEVGIDAGQVTCNAKPIMTELVPSIDSETTSASIAELAGGTAYIYTQPLTSLSVASVANTTVEDRLTFTLASGGSVSIPASCGVCPSGFSFEGGKSYVMAVMGGMVVAAEYQPGVTE